MIRMLATGLALLGASLAAHAAPPTGPASATSAPAAPAATPLAPAQYTALPVATNTATAAPMPQFTITVPLDLKGLPLEAEMASVSCAISIGTAGATSASKQVEIPIPPPASPAPGTLRELVTRITVPVTFPPSTLDSDLKGRASYKCYLFVRSNDTVLAPLVSSGDPRRARFPLAPNASFTVTATGAFP